MKKHRLDNGDYPYENGHMNGEWCASKQNNLFIQNIFINYYFKAFRYAERLEQGGKGGKVLMKRIQGKGRDSRKKNENQAEQETKNKKKTARTNRIDRCAPFPNFLELQACASAIGA